MDKALIKIRFIKKDNIFIIIPLLQKLNASISKSTLEKRLQEMVHQNYTCVGVFYDGKLIGISGIWLLTKYYVGKHIEPDNVYILEDYQGNGIGEMLFDFIFTYAKKIGCVSSELNCYLENKLGHQFWEKLGYQKMAYHFSKKI